MTELKALAASFIIAVVAAASVLLAIKTLGFSVAVQYGCSCAVGAGTFFFGRAALNNKPANVQVIETARKKTKSRFKAARQLKPVGSSFNQVSDLEKQLPHLLKGYAGLRR